MNHSPDYCISRCVIVLPHCCLPACKSHISRALCAQPVLMMREQMNMSEDSSEMGKVPQCCWFVQTNRVLPSKPQIQGISLMSRYRNGNCGLSPESCWPAVGSISEGPCKAAHSPKKKKVCSQSHAEPSRFVSVLAVILAFSASIKSGTMDRLPGCCCRCLYQQGPCLAALSCTGMDCCRINA